MIKNKILFMFSFLFNLINKKEDASLKIPDDWRAVRDVDLLDIDVSLIKIHKIQSLSDSITTSGVFEQVIGEYQLGLKSLNYLFLNQSMIPEECKSKTTLFLGTICVDKENRLWVPKLYHLVFQKEWRMSFFCLSVDRISCKSDIILLSDFSKN